MRPARHLGLDEETGAFNPNARPPRLEMQQHDYGGRARLDVIKHDLPAHYALGLRDALRAALARVEADLIEAGVPFDVDG